MDISSKGPTRPNEDNIHQEKVIHVLYTNADCLHNKLSKLILLIESFKHKPNIIAITEFKNKCSKELYIQEFNIPGYVLYCNNTSNLSRGVLLYVDSNLKSSEVFFDSLFKEFVIVKIKGANKGKGKSEHL